MRTLTTLVLAHRRHIIESVVVSLAIFAGLTLSQWFGIGGIRINSALLLGGFALAECGRSLFCFGVKLENRFLEYSGVLVQGLAWWLWCMNLDFLKDKTGFSLAINMLIPAVLLGFAPVTLHWLRKLLMGPNPHGHCDKCSTPAPAPKHETPSSDE